MVNSGAISVVANAAATGATAQRPCRLAAWAAPWPARSLRSASASTALQNDQQRRTVTASANANAVAAGTVLGTGSAKRRPRRSEWINALLRSTVSQSIANSGALNVAANAAQRG